MRVIKNSKPYTIIRNPKQKSSQSGKYFYKMLRKEKGGSYFLYFSHVLDSDLVPFKLLPAFLVIYKNEKIKNMKFNLKLGAMILGVGLLTASFNSCKKKDNPVSADTQAAQDNAYAEGTYNDAYNAVDVAARSNGATSLFKTAEATLDMLSGASVTITLDTISVLRKVTIDFGTGTSCKDGRIRSGQIIATWNGRYRDSGSVISITFKNYTVNGNQVTGTKTVTNLGHNSKGNLHFSIVVTGASITTSTGTISWQSTRDREWVAGESTIDWTDDVYNITGSASGTNRKGQTFTITIVKPLVVALNCHWIESGSFDISTSASNSTGTVDYGPGACDDQATFTYNGKSYDFTLR